MHITVEYSAQLKQAAGTGREIVELPTMATLHDLVCVLVERHGDALRPLLRDVAGNLHPSILAFVNDDQCRNAAGRELHDGDTVALLPPISGG